MTGWQAATFPSEVRDEQRVVLVEDAWLTRFSRGDLRSFETPNRWIAGAVHDAEGRLVVESQMVGSYGGRNLLAADPPRAPRRGRPDELAGTWLYGGNFMEHFGHFISEGVSTLWPDDLAVDGLVFHRYLGRPPEVAGFHRELLALTGYGDLPVHIVTGRPAAVERLWVPTRPVVVNGWAHPEAVAVWRRIVAGVGGPAPAAGPLWLSRTAFNERQRAAGRPVRSSAERDRELDAVFAAAGFRVVAPEALPVPEQIRLVAGSDVVAGQAGTALHLAVFAEEGTRCIEVGDSRTREQPLLNQQVLNAVRGHQVAFVPQAVPAPEIAVLLDRLEVAR